MLSTYGIVPRYFYLTQSRHPYRTQSYLCSYKIGDVQQPVPVVCGVEAVLRQEWAVSVPENPTKQVTIDT